MNRLEKIAMLKVKLTSLDYKTIKYTQGALSEEEWQETKRTCEELRRQINELEQGSVIT